MKNKSKSPAVQKLINEAIEIISAVGIPIDKETNRRQERMAMAFLAVAGVSKNWKTSKSLKDGRKITTREIIDFMNEFLEEKLSRGSYDDIRDEELKKFVLADLIINSGDNPSAKRNDPTRGYSLENDFKELVKTFGTSRWKDELSKFIQHKGQIADLFDKPRSIERLPVHLSKEETILLSKSYHDTLQKSIIENFLAYFGHEADLLYVGDASNRVILHKKTTLDKLNFFSIGSGKLPDIIAYSETKNWLFLIEAVTSSGPMTDDRVIELQKLMPNCTADIIFVTAFLTKQDFKKHAAHIGWETEVWIADNPKHLIHFNGHKFLGPFLNNQ